MLAGRWPEKNCSYCRDIEQTGGVSDRMRQQTLPYEMPPELHKDSQAVEITPTVVEVFFTNTCNMACLYCVAPLSSSIAAENQRHGHFKKHGVELAVHNSQFHNFIDELWKWFPDGFPKLRRFHMLGGEPFFQAEFDHLLNLIEQHPNPHCEFNIVTNLMVAPARLKNYITRFQRLLDRQCLRRIDITCSIDCWGPEQEYVRWGLKLDTWQQNFQTLLTIPHFYLNINQVITPLTIKTMPELLTKLQTWRQQHQVGHWFQAATPQPDYLRHDILGRTIFEQDIEIILDMMPQDNAEDQTAHSYMSGILNSIPDHVHPERVRDMFVYLEEKDRRRGTSWRRVFPWLQEFEHYVV